MSQTANTRAEAIRALTETLTPPLTSAVTAWGDVHLRNGQAFADVQAATIIALIFELGRVIATGPAPMHRRHIAVVQDTLTMMVREHAVLMAAGEPGE